MAKKYAMKINSRRKFFDREGISVNEINKKVPHYYIKPKKCIRDCILCSYNTTCKYLPYI